MEGENWFHNRAKNEVAICSAIGALEIYGKNYDEFEVNWRTNKIWRKFAGGNRRDVVKFVAKRLPCTCLKELHRAAREKVAKVGICCGCHEKFPISELYVCTGCMITDYCSMECQRAHWSLHKECCQRNHWSNHKKGCGHSKVMSPDLSSDYVL